MGRTARAGRSGKAITFVSQYDVELYQVHKSVSFHPLLYSSANAEMFRGFSAPDNCDGVRLLRIRYLDVFCQSVIHKGFLTPLREGRERENFLEF